MNVLHIVPAAFHYFDDILARAFQVIDEQKNFGVTAEALTVQFGNISSSALEKKTGPVVSSTREYKGTIDNQTASSLFQSADILHVHWPLFGMASKISVWKKQHPTIPLVITYYRPVLRPDFFSLILAGYACYYARPLFRLADAICAVTPDAIPARLRRISGGPFFGVDETPYFLDNDIEAGEAEVLTSLQRLALKYAIIYNSLVSN